MGTGIGTMILILVGVMFFFLPIMIASHREHPYKWPIAIVNILLGLTFIGWVIALAWSVSPFKKVEVL